jgi:hypothetical protein
MPVFIAHLISDDGIVVIENVEMCIECVRQGSAQGWHGYFALPLDPEPHVTLGTYDTHCADGRRGQILITRMAVDETLTFLFQGTGALCNGPPPLLSSAPGL